MTTLLLIRHGQTEWNRLRKWQGHADIPLNATGRQQAQALAQRLSTWHIDVMYASPLQRAHETAQIVAAPHQLTIHVDSVWQERDAGLFSGMTGEDIKRDYPEKYAEMQGGLMNPINGESNEALLQRIVPAYERVVAQHKGEVVAIVSHGGSLAALVTHVLGLPIIAGRRFSLGGNTGLSKIEITERRGARLTLLNDISHLDSNVSA